MQNIELTLNDLELLPYFRKFGVDHYVAACPQCGGDPSPEKIRKRDNSPPDRFCIWYMDAGQKARFWCRRCGFQGFTGENGGLYQIDPQRVSMLAEMRLEREKIAETERQNEAARKKTILQQLNESGLHKKYHQALNGHTDLVHEWYGLSDDSIEIWEIGYCSTCPLACYSDSLTIPYFWKDQIINIRHRLLNPNGEGKYRPHAKGLGNAIFNANLLLAEDWIVLCEGEFKPIFLNQKGFPAIGIPGVASFDPSWVRLFGKVKQVHICLDPGQDGHAWQIGRLLAEVVREVRVCTLMDEPDYLFTKWGSTVGDFAKVLEQGRLVT